MKKLLLSILLLLTFASQGWATVWYASGVSGHSCASGNMSTCYWYSTPGDTTSCTTTAGSGLLTWNSQAAGDTFVANGCVGITINVDPQGTGGSAGIVTLRNDYYGSAGYASGGGTFLYATASQLTITANFIAGQANCLTISGSQSGTAGTILGNITSSSTTNTIYGVVDSHTVGTMIYGSSGTPITITGGTGSADSGVLVNNSGPSTFYANLVAGTTGYSSCAITFSYISSAITLIGNMINNSSNMAVCARSLIWNPTAKNYIAYYANGAVTYFSPGLGNSGGTLTGNAATEAPYIATSQYFVGPNSASYTQGSATAGGGTATGY